MSNSTRLVLGAWGCVFCLWLSYLAASSEPPGGQPTLLTVWHLIAMILTALATIPIVMGVCATWKE